MTTPAMRGAGSPAIFLLGPTASGKTELAMRLADRFPVELISVDSAQVYRDMDIGTAKPDAPTRARYPHHLIDIASPEDAYSAARFASDARAVVEQIHRRGRVPLFVGGTMLYARALLQGLSRMPAADAAVRAAIEAEAARTGWPALHARLAEIDPVTAARLKPNDRQRIQRALEVHQVSGKPISHWQGAADKVAAPYAPLLGLALVPHDRATLHRRIAVRFQAMLAAGLVEETAALRQRYRLVPELPSMRAVGYRQAWQFLDGSLKRDQLEAQGIAATRQLAKRQLTWLRAMPEMETVDALAPDLSARVIDRVGMFLSR